ncbi:hypothetical protein [Nocardia sp. NPDC057440]|uniref:hypothetical protein n=1 Tax=Nocardia sp. NPDC057440 TaxID=3346134 RepID=UPI00366CD702
MKNRPSQETEAPDPPPMYDALILTATSDVRYTDLSPGLSDDQIRAMSLFMPVDHVKAMARECPVVHIKRLLAATEVEVDHLDGGIDLWRDLGAVLADDPQMNFGAMWLVQHLRSPLGVPVIYGPVIFTSRDSDGLPRPLSVDAIRLLQRTLTLSVEKAQIPTTG